MRFKTIYDTYEISIHAPSRERLDSGYLVPIFVDISIHAPSRERLDSGYLVPIFVDISIHAPSRERHNLPKEQKLH